MIEYPYAETGYVKCSCCGGFVANTPDENVALHQPEGTPYPSDDGFGMCKACGGDPHTDIDDTSEANVRKRLGWGGECFYDTRIELLAEKLNEKNSAKFKAMPYAKQVAMVVIAIEKGWIV